MLKSHISCGVFDPVTWLNGSACTYTDPLAVFRFHLDTNEPVPLYLDALLQPNERQRAVRYHRLEDRQRYTYGRALLRIVSGLYVGQPPDQIRIEPGINNKPVVQNNDGWWMNLSHAGTWVVLIVGKGEVGVDIERLNPDFSYQDLLPASFSLAEQDFIQTGPDAHQRFYTLWTRKEALLKATAKGIDEDFSQIPSLIGQYDVGSSLIGKPGNWKVNSFNVAPDYPAAIAYPITLQKPIFYTLGRVLFDETESKWKK